MEAKIFVMAKEPSPELAMDDLPHLLNCINSEKDLADVYASISNKAWWVADEIDDFTEGTQEYNDAVHISDTWFSAENTLREKIFTILKNKGIIIPEKGYITVLIPFMERNGYIDGSGWWVKKE